MLTKSPVLVVDDEPAICWCLEQLLVEDGYQVVTASSAEEGLRLATDQSPRLIILDVRLPGMDGLTALPKFNAICPRVPVVVVTAFGDLQTAVQAVRLGAADYLTKPFGTEQVRKICRTVLRQTDSADTFSTNDDRPEFAAVPAAKARRIPPTLVGRSPAMQEVYRQIAMVAGSDLSVLITGETGTGKELIAAAIHTNSLRRELPYVPIAPVSLNPTLIESELFGHVKGAFTGANENRPGLFAMAEGGTILLDEIGDLTLGVQVKLLRVLEQRQFTPVGDIRPRDCNVRILAATHRDLRSAIARGEFREDLYYRLAAVEIHAPPLRDRLDDLEMLVQYFLSVIGHPGSDQPVDREVLRALQQRTWPGNIRELRNVIEHAAVMSRGRLLGTEHLPDWDPLADAPTTDPQTVDPLSKIETAFPGDSLSQAVRDWTLHATQCSQANPDVGSNVPLRNAPDSSSPDSSSPADGDLMDRFLAAVEPAMLEVVLQRTSGNRAAAAQWLGIHRGTLRERLRKYGLD